MLGLMHDSLHLRSKVTVRGRKGKTILRKAGAASSRLTLDGDFGERQLTVADASGFAVGAGVAIWDDLVDVSLTRWYHCMTRCVRRAFLLGETGHNRKVWLEDRLEELAGIGVVPFDDSILNRGSH
jgi:hypothetical protein